MQKLILRIFFFFAIQNCFTEKEITSVCEIKMHS